MIARIKPSMLKGSSTRQVSAVEYDNKHSPPYLIPHCPKSFSEGLNFGCFGSEKVMHARKVESKQKSNAICCCSVRSFLPKLLEQSIHFFHSSVGSTSYVVNCAIHHFVPHGKRLENMISSSRPRAANC